MAGILLLSLFLFFQRNQTWCLFPLINSVLDRRNCARKKSNYESTLLTYVAAVLNICGRYFESCESAAISRNTEIVWVLLWFSFAVAFPNGYEHPGSFAFRRRTFRSRNRGEEFRIRWLRVPCKVTSLVIGRWLLHAVSWMWSCVSRCKRVLASSRTSLGMSRKRSA